MNLEILISQSEKQKTLHRTMYKNNSGLIAKMKVSVYKKVCV